MAFKKILVPIDGSENSEHALESVTGLAEKLSAEIVLLAVTGSHADFDIGDGSAPRDDAGSANRYLDHKAEPLRARGLSVSTEVEAGIPADVIMSAARRSGADLIAMSTHRESVIARGILGSVTDSVLRASPVPVLAINPESTAAHVSEGWVPSTVIIPLDGSKLAEECVPTALDIAEACGAEAVFIRAVHLPSYAISGPGAEYYGVDYGVSAKRDGAQKYLEQFVEMAKSKGLSASSHAALGNAAARIIEETTNVPDAMIVISSHGRSGVRRMILGSVADKIVRSSHHPVLVLKHEG